MLDIQWSCHQQEKREQLKKIPAFHFPRTEDPIFDKKVTSTAHHPQTITISRMNSPERQTISARFPYTVNSYSLEIT